VEARTRAAARDRCDGSTAPIERVPCPFGQPFSLDLNGTVAARVRSATHVGMVCQLEGVKHDEDDVRLSHLSALRNKSACCDSRNKCTRLNLNRHSSRLSLLTTSLPHHAQRNLPLARGVRRGWTGADDVGTRQYNAAGGEAGAGKEAVMAGGKRRCVAAGCRKKSERIH
jgi:hypothetical protein